MIIKSFAEPGRGDPGPSFEDFYAGHAGRLITQLYLVAGSMEEARDCVQDAFARAWLHWDELRRDGANPVAWVNTVGYRIAVSGWRRRRAARRALDRSGPAQVIPPPSPDTVAVAAALARLTPGQRAVVVLHYYADLRVEEIAAALNLTPSGVKSRLARARTALGPLLSERIDDPPADQEEEAHRG
jgi:RNA polymerase sigma-70 factor (ECF subfamily)